jgi:2-polyprenyl-3-methyl-5-hydroxy-6-metoxy-1,4-benzoquinol methylase
VASFRPIEVLDIRANESHQKNIVFRRADLMEQNADLNEYADSVSCLHTIEHFGLGRYGDPIDIDGHLKGLSNIMSMVKKGGTFYFSTPIGPQRIEFNAHRVFSVGYLLNILTNGFELKAFSYVDDNGDFHENISLDKAQIESNCGCDFGCGIFILKKQ